MSSVESTLVIAMLGLVIVGVKTLGGSMSTTIEGSVTRSAIEASSVSATPVLRSKAMGGMTQMLSKLDDLANLYYAKKALLKVADHEQGVRLQRILARAVDADDVAIDGYVSEVNGMLNGLRQLEDGFFEREFDGIANQLGDIYPEMIDRELDLALSGDAHSPTFLSNLTDSKILGRTASERANDARYIRAHETVIAKYELADLIRGSVPDGETPYLMSSFGREFGRSLSLSKSADDLSLPRWKTDLLRRLVDMIPETDQQTSVFFLPGEKTHRLVTREDGSRSLMIALDGDAPQSALNAGFERFKWLESFAPQDVESSFVQLSGELELAPPQLPNSPVEHHADRIVKPGIDARSLTSAWEDLIGSKVDVVEPRYVEGSDPWVRLSGTKDGRPSLQFGGDPQRLANLDPKEWERALRVGRDVMQSDPTTDGKYRNFMVRAFAKEPHQEFYLMLQGTGSRNSHDQSLSLRLTPYNDDNPRAAIINRIGRHYMHPARPPEMSLQEWHRRYPH